MSDMLQAGAAWLAGQLKAHASRTVEYRRGGSLVPELQVTVGQSLLKTTNDFGDLVMVHTDRDYVFSAADLVIDGEAVTPQKGDVVADAVSGVVELYEALALPNEKPWRYTDGTQTMIRLHTKRVGTED